MSEEFNLSEKICDDEFYIETKDVKEFIRLDMELIQDLLHKRITRAEFFRRRDKLVGSNLIDLEGKK